MKKKTFCFLASFFVFLASTQQLAHAEQSADETSGESRPEKSPWRRFNWAISISPRVYTVNTDGYNTAFLNNGFSGPQGSTVSYDIYAYLITQNHWQLGIEAASLGYQNGNGSSAASFAQDYYGFWLGKEFEIFTDVQFSIGAVFGGGYAHVLILSTSANGRTGESSFLFEPKILLSYRATDWMKIGVSASYLEPLAQNDSITGQTLTSGNISTHGASAGLELVFGRFNNI